MASYALSHVDLPWSLTNDDARFKKILKTLVIVYLVVSIPLSFIKMPEPTRAEREQLPPQLARVMLEQQELPVPVPIEPEPVKVEEKPVEEVTEEVKPEEIKPEQKKIIEKPAEKTPVRNTQQPVRDSGGSNNEAAVTEAREKASNSGIMQFKDDLMEMRETLQTTAVETAATTVSNGAGEATQVDRSMINSGVTRGSGGINVGALASNGTGGVALGGRKTTKVTSGLAEATKKAAAGSGGGTGGGNSDGAGGAARSEEEVRKIMEQHKGAIFNIYNRALRENAALQGKVVVKIVIDPSGQVVDATIVSSELKDPELEAKLLQRIKLISFSASNVTRTTLNYSFDFLPQ
ncbi:MAG: AgmX/PglI C-terminal domain-containing protein [Pseudomonadota bacterium]